MNSACTPLQLTAQDRPVPTVRRLAANPPGESATGHPKGYLLYSVGVNGKDEGGAGPDDNPPGDDPSVRMPLPPVKREK